MRKKKSPIDQVWIQEKSNSDENTHVSDKENKVFCFFFFFMWTAQRTLNSTPPAITSPVTGVDNVQKICIDNQRKETKCYTFLGVLFYGFSLLQRL